MELLRSPPPLRFSEAPKAPENRRMECVRACRQAGRFLPETWEPPLSVLPEGRVGGWVGEFRRARRRKTLHVHLPSFTFFPAGPAGPSLAGPSFLALSRPWRFRRRVLFFLPSFCFVFFSFLCGRRLCRLAPRRFKYAAFKNFPARPRHVASKRVAPPRNVCCAFFCLYVLFAFFFS